ncbi:MAG TPA: tRNA (guanosine(46)-N7)-methyltransferase TrmB [Steroidobacteraceae bacterium]|nr:tRNA (guanosine(46)-N7)-methyltransferase TrmB [Steroidobacteraceae bacterium]
MTDSEHHRAVRSFVTRAGRITDAQQRALTELWPRYGIEYGAGEIDLDALFGRTVPRVVEIGFGNGENLARLAALHPERDYVGIEVHRPGVGRLLLELEAAHLTNVRVVCHDAVEVFERQIAPGCLAEVWILFPDPWPKKRHHKRRLIQAPFVELVASRLRPAGVLRLATDWEPYAQAMVDVLLRSPSLRNLAAAGPYAPPAPERAATRFQRRGERLGHGVWDLAFERVA